MGKKLGIDDVLDEFGERLEKMGLRLDILRDDCPESPLDMTDARLAVVCRPDSRDSRNVPNESGDHLEWDLESPWDARGGFSPRSLFLYLNGMEDIRKWMEGGFGGAGGPSCGEAGRLLDRLLRVSWTVQEGQAELAMGQAADALDDGPGLLSGDMEDRMHEIDVWLSDMMGPSSGGTPNTMSYLADSPFTAEGNGCAVGCRALAGLSLAAESGDAAAFSRCLADAQRDLAAWIREFGNSFGGELLFAKAAKRDFALEFGGEAPAGAAGVYAGDGSGNAFPADAGDADYVVIMHAKNARGIADPQALAEGVARDEAAFLNGDVFGYSVVNDETDAAASGDGMSSCWGFYGTDMEKNGLRAAVSDTVKCLEERKAERPRAVRPRQ